MQNLIYTPALILASGASFDGCNVGIGTGTLVGWLLFAAVLAGMHIWRKISASAQ